MRKMWTILDILKFAMSLTCNGSGSMLLVATKVRYKINGQSGSQHFLVDSFLGEFVALRGPEGYLTRVKQNLKIKNLEIGLSLLGYGKTGIHGTG